MTGRQTVPLPYHFERQFVALLNPSEQNRRVSRFVISSSNDYVINSAAAQERNRTIVGKAAHQLTHLV